MQHPVSFTPKDPDLYICNRIRDEKLSPPSAEITKTLKGVPKKSELGQFKIKVVELICSNYRPYALEGVRFSLIELNNVKKILKIFVQIIDIQNLKSKNDKSCHILATSLIAKIQNLVKIPLKFSLQIRSEVISTVNEKIRELVREHTGLKESQLFLLLGNLREGLKDSDQNVSLRDICIMRQKLKESSEGEGLAKLLKPVDHQEIVHKYTDLMAQKPSFITDEPNGIRLTGVFCRERINEFMTRLELIFKEGLESEHFRQTKIFTEKMTAKLSKKSFELRCNPENSRCLLAPNSDTIHLSQASFNPFDGHKIKNFACRMIGREGLEKQNPSGFNGDGALFCEFPEGKIHLLAVADAEENVFLSQACTTAVLSSIFNTTVDYLKEEEFNCIGFACHIRKNAFLETLRSTKTCSLAYTLAFPFEDHFLLVGGAYGDPSIWFLTPDLKLHEFNPPPENKLRSSSYGSLGEMIKDKFTAGLQHDFWQFKAPPGTFVILATDGCGMHFESETYERSNVKAPEIRKRGWTKGEIDPQVPQISLHNEYADHLILDLCKGRETAQDIAQTLMDYCLFHSNQLTGGNGAIDDITISVFQLPQLGKEH